MAEPNRNWDRLVRAVRDDVTAGLARKGLVPAPQEGHREAFEVLEDVVAPSLFDDDEGKGAVAWQIHVRHAGPFEGIPPTGQTVQIMGSTHVVGFGSDRDGPQFVRFVDWAAVLGQLGVTFNCKPLVNEELLEALDGEPPP